MTKREIDVLRLSALGHTDTSMAKALGVHFETVRSVQKAIRVKLQARNKAHCVYLGLEYIKD